MMILLKIYFLIQLFINLTQSAVNPTDTYENLVILVKPDLYYLYWNFTTDSIIVEIHAKTAGWVSFGITSNGNIDRSDVFIGWVNNDKSVKFVDAYVKDKNLFVDNIQNWVLLNATQTSGYTIFKAKRKIILCDVDSSEDLNIESGTPYVSYAWGDNDPEEVVDYFNANLNTQPVPLLSVRKKAVKSETVSIHTFSTNSTNPTLPNDQTMIYKCFSVDLNPNNTKRHLIKFETVLDATNVRYVYDWVLFECPTDFNKSSLTILQNLTCGLGDNNGWVDILNNQCNKIVILWTVGNFLEQEFPGSVGYPFGGLGAASTYIVRIRYENPDLDLGVRDNVSIKLTFTSDLRTNEAGTLSVGAKNSITGLVLPPGVNELTINSYCLSGCIDSMLPDFTYLNIFASVPHTHQSGTKVYTKLIRAGSEYSYVARNKFYNSSYQYSIFLQNPVVFKRGDQLITTCKYSTRLETDFYFGPDEETCLNVLYYYPRISGISYCYTQPTLTEWNNFLVNLNKTGAIYEQNLLINQTNLDLDLTIAEGILSQIKVNDQVRSSFQSFYDNAKQTLFCGFNKATSAITQLKVPSTLTDDKQCALNDSTSNKINNILFSFLLFFLLIVNF